MVVREASNCFLFFEILLFSRLRCLVWPYFALDLSVWNLNGFLDVPSREVFVSFESEF